MNEIWVFFCTKCDLAASRWKLVDTDGDWMRWECWACGHTIGIVSKNRGELDLGLATEERS